MQPLAPMLVQYLVGLCCLRRDPDAVDVVLGDLVLDTAAGKSRDVDITVTVREDDETLRAFKAYEVKRESRPLDVAVIEQLSAKLRDMPVVTHRAIVSASGFTAGAIAKAAAHGVELYDLQPWKITPGTGMPSFSREALPMFIRTFERQLLCWADPKVWLYASKGPSSFTWTRDQKAFGASGAAHARYEALGAFIDALLLESTGTLLHVTDRSELLSPLSTEPMTNGRELHVTPLGWHTHTLDVTEYGVYLNFGTMLAQVETASITGRLQWERSVVIPQFYLMERVPDGVPFAGAAIAEYGTPDDRMCALIFAPDSRVVGVHPTIQLHEKHRNAIRQLRIGPPSLGT